MFGHPRDLIEENPINLFEYFFEKYVLGIVNLTIFFNKFNLSKNLHTFIILDK